MTGYLISEKKNECCGCEACVQACAQGAIHMDEDDEGFRYPSIDEGKCISCGECHSVCPCEHPVDFKPPQYVFGGSHIDPLVCQTSTSGGAFSAIVDAWCDENYVVFGAASDGLQVFHCFVTDRAKTTIFRKSKYSQSKIGTSYADVRGFLRQGKKVLFSGTPCQIAGLKAFLRGENQEQLLSVEVICEGVPSPLFIRKYGQYLQGRYGASVKELDYRDKDGRRWDFQVMTTMLQNGRRVKMDRWFNPFWSIWLAHLMSRPSCYECPYTMQERAADITLGDLWGVHLYCPELYNRNGGASLVICCTEKGQKTMELAASSMHGHKLDFETALNYQSPLRKPIARNAQRGAFMRDLLHLSYSELCRKWASKPAWKLLWSKYVWGNRQKVFLGNIGCRMQRRNR